MPDKEIWGFSMRNKVSARRCFGRDFIWIKKEDFWKIKDNFRLEKNLFHRGFSLRTNSYFSHLHAVEQGELVFIHRDFGNYRRLPILIVFHLLFDFFPFMIFCAWKRKKPKFFMIADL